MLKKQPYSSMKLSQISQIVRSSGIRKIFNRAQEYENVISFALGEPDFTASEDIVEAGCSAIRNGKTKYTVNAGILELRSAISDMLYSDYQIRYDPTHEIIVTTGAMGALYLALKVLLDPGDSVVVCDPGWTNYYQQILMCGGTPVPLPVHEEQHFQPAVEDLHKVICSSTRAIILNSPCNPTGAILSKETLGEIARLAVEHDCVVLFDEVYKRILYTEEGFESICTYPGMRDRTVVIDSLSKSYAMTGWRLGYAAGPEAIIANMTKFQENIVSAATTPCQYAALEAITGDQAHLKHMVREYARRREYVCDRLAQIPGLKMYPPQGTFYAFVDITQSGMNADDFAYGLLDSKQVVVVPGTAFGSGGDGYIRLSFATSMENIREGLDRIASYMEGIRDAYVQ